MPFSDVSDSIAFRHDIEIASNCTGVCPHGERIRLSIESIVTVYFSAYTLNGKEGQMIGTRNVSKVFGHLFIAITREVLYNVGTVFTYIRSEQQSGAPSDCFL